MWNLIKRNKKLIEYNNIFKSINLILSMVKYNKLIRDKIPKIIEKSRKIPKTHIASEKEYWKKLKEKLREEVNEFIKDSDENELSDILEVLEAISWYKNFDKNKVRKMKKKKQIERGGFKERIILEEVID